MDEVTIRNNYKKELESGIKLGIIGDCIGTLSVGILIGGFVITYVQNIWVQILILLIPVFIGSILVYLSINRLKKVNRIIKIEMLKSSKTDKNEE